MSEFYDEIYKRLLEGEVIKDSRFAGQVFMVTMFVGIFTHLIFSNFYSKHGTYGPASALIWGYSIVVVSIIAILFSDNMMEMTNGVSNSISFEIIGLIILMIWLITINIRHFTKLNTNKVPPMFNTYSSFTTILIGVQLLLFIIKRVMANGNNAKFVALLNQFGMAYTFLLALIFILVIVQQIILNNFSVDVL